MILWFDFSVSNWSVMAQQTAFCSSYCQPRGGHRKTWWIYCRNNLDALLCQFTVTFRAAYLHVHSQNGIWAFAKAVIRVFLCSQCTSKCQNNQTTSKTFRETSSIFCEWNDMLLTTVICLFPCWFFIVCTFMGWTWAFMGCLSIKTLSCMKWKGWLSFWDLEKTYTAGWTKWVNYQLE